MIGDGSSFDHFEDRSGSQGGAGDRFVGGVGVGVDGAVLKASEILRQGPSGIGDLQGGSGEGNSRVELVSRVGIGVCRAVLEAREVLGEGPAGVSELQSGSGKA